MGFLRMMSRFGVFSFGPISIYVPAVEAAVPAALEEAARQLTVPSARFQRFVELLMHERERSGRAQIDELHALLAFMKLGEGLPGRVFGELGVSPAQVEEYARRGGDTAPAELERLFTPEEAAAYLGIHVQTVRAWIRSGRLRASRLTGQRALRIKASDLATVLEPVDVEGDA